MAKKRVKRPRIPVQLAKLIGNIAKGQMQDAVEDRHDPAAVASGQKGGLKKARAKSLSKKQRSEVAKRAAKRRWGWRLPKSWFA